MKKRNERSQKQMKILSTVFITLFILLFLLISFLIGRPMVTFASQPEKFRQWVDSKGIWGPLLYMWMVFLQVVIAIIPGEPLEIVGGYAFGTGLGTILCLAGASVGSLTVFLLVRKFGFRLANIFFSAEKLHSLRFLKSSPGRIILFLLIFMIPGTPKDLLCYFAGLTDIKLGIWLLISLFGRVPSVLTSTMGGNALGTERYIFAVVVFASTFVVSIIGMILYRIISTRHNARHCKKDSK